MQATVDPLTHIYGIHTAQMTFYVPHQNTRKRLSIETAMSFAIASNS